MLVLTRKTNEAICIGHDVYVTILAVQGGKVRLGIDASPDVPIRRTELDKGTVPDVRHVPIMHARCPVEANCEAI